MTVVVDPLDLVDAATIARRLDVSKAAIVAWRRREPSFPKPVETPGLSHFVYSWREIDLWHRTYFAQGRISLRTAHVKIDWVYRDLHGYVYYTQLIKRRRL